MAAENLNNQNQPMSPDDALRQLQENAANAEALRNRELESVECLELTTLGLIEQQETAEGGRDEENAVQWPLSSHMQQLLMQKVNMARSTSVLVSYAHAEPVPNKPGWFTKVPSSYGFEVTPVVVKETDGTQRWEDRVRLGTNEQRTERVRRIDKFTREAFARLKFAGLYGHMFKKSIESISNLATLYLGTVDIKPADIKALLTLPENPNDIGTSLKSEGGVEFPAEQALGRMMVASWQIFNAVGLSEKPEMFKKFVSEQGWSTNIIRLEPTRNQTDPTLPPTPGPPSLNNGVNGSMLDNPIFREWFGDPEGHSAPEIRGQIRGWKSEVKNDGSWRNRNVNDLRTDKTWQNESGLRGRLTKWGNVFVREEGNLDEGGFEIPRDFRDEVVAFLGGSETAKQAVDLGWKYFRLFAAADFVGCEWYYKDGTIHASIPLGSDFTSDFGKAIHPDAYLEFYHKNSRGGVPRGEYGGINPFAADVLRVLNFGENYVGPDGNRLGVPMMKDGSPVLDENNRAQTERVSLYELLFVYGVQPDQINYRRLADRALISPYLRFFMSNCGREYGDGSFDIMTDKIGSPDPYMTPAFWEKLKSKLHVGITKENVAWVNFMKTGENYHMPSSGEVDEYRLEMMRTMLDGIFAEEISRSWENDKTRERRGRTKADRFSGDPEAEDTEYGVTERIIAAANSAIGGLKYPLSRVELVRKANLKNPSKDIYKV